MKQKTSSGWSKGQWILVIVLVLVFLASGIVDNPISRMARNAVGDVQKYWTTPKIQTATPTKTDVATLTQDEVCALVYNYLENKINAMTHLSLRMSCLNTLNKARPDFHAVYQGKGKWTVAALGQWNLYEASGVIEPADDKAREWLYYIQRRTTTRIEDKETTPTPTIIASSAPAVSPAGLQAIESRIDGEFQGWDGETIFRLMNGQIWQQAEYSYLYHYAYMPRVTIFSVSGGYKMQVEGINKAIRVQRLR
ncbi:MAG: hypothetical protein JXB43_09700 [Dehalococcoidia bacterium]|nr:hypothetical protein [Dehalococcoidia bacterium]